VGPGAAASPLVAAARKGSQGWRGCSAPVWLRPCRKCILQSPRQHQLCPEHSSIPTDFVRPELVLSISQNPAAIEGHIDHSQRGYAPVRQARGAGFLPSKGVWRALIAISNICMVDTNIGYLLPLPGPPNHKSKSNRCSLGWPAPLSCVPLDAEEAGLWQPRSALDADPPTTSPTMEGVRFPGSPVVAPGRAPASLLESKSARWCLWRGLVRVPNTLPWSAGL
jgi:hypothetical protein